MNNLQKDVLELVKQDPVFARIYLSPEPQTACEKTLEKIWRTNTEKFVGEAWIYAAMDASKGIFKPVSDYTNEAQEADEVKIVQSFFKRSEVYRSALIKIGENPFTDYLYGISVEDFVALLQDKDGMDAAREIQYLYQKGILASDLGASKLHSYMTQLGLPYVPHVSKLGAAKRGEIPAQKYSMRRQGQPGYNQMAQNKYPQVKPL